MGKKEYQKIKACTSLCCYGSLVIGFLFSVALLMNLTDISNAIGANVDTMEYTCTYLRILAFGGPIILFGNVFNNLIRADGSARQSMISNGLGTIANIILDPVLILGAGMGVAGAAAATVAGNMISFLYLIWYVMKKQKAFSLNFRDLSLKKEVVIPIVTFAMGLCMGLQPAISYNCGAGEYRKMYQIVRNLGLMTVAIGSLLTAGCLIGKSYLVAMFIEHEEVVSLGERMVVASMLMGPFYGLYQLCTTFLQSTGKASYATIVALLDKGIIYLPVLFGLNVLLGLNGVIYTAPLTDMLSLMVGAVLCFIWNRKLAGNSTVPESQKAF